MEDPEADRFGRILQVIGATNIALLLFGRAFLFFAGVFLAAGAY